MRNSHSQKNSRTLRNKTRKNKQTIKPYKGETIVMFTPSKKAIEIANKDPVKYLYREQVKTTLYIITLKNGYTVTKTFSHKLFDGSVWTNSIIIGCRIAYYDYIRNKISYDEVVDVNEIYYDDFVYDLSIEKYHNFIANYICCHNILNSNQNHSYMCCPTRPNNLAWLFEGQVLQ